MEDLENKIPDVSKLVTNIAFNSKIGEIENKIPGVSKLVTNSAFDTKIVEVENKIPNVSRLVINTTFNTKIREVEKIFLLMLNILLLSNLINFQVQYLMKH